MCFRFLTFVLRQALSAAWLPISRRASLPSVRRVVLYNFGSPRVGNAAFAAIIDNDSNYLLSVATWG